MAQVVHHRAHNVGKAIGLGGLAPQGVVQPVKFLLGLLLMAEHLDHLLPGDHLLNVAVDGPQGLLLAHKVFAGAAADLPGEEQHKAYHRQHQQGQGDAGGHHGAEHRRQGDYCVEQLGDALGDKHAQGVRVVGVAAHHIPVGVGVKILDGQLLHVGEQVVPDIL